MSFYCLTVCHGYLASVKFTFFSLFVCLSFGLSLCVSICLCLSLSLSQYVCRLTWVPSILPGAVKQNDDVYEVNEVLAPAIYLLQLFIEIARPFSTRRSEKMNLPRNNNNRNTFFIYANSCSSSIKCSGQSCYRQTGEQER